MSDLPSVNDWSPRLVLDLALGLDDELTLCERHKLSVDDLNRFLCNPVFAAHVGAMRVELQENGEVFKAKAKVQAEMLLETSWTLIHSGATPANVKADLIKSTVEWAGLKPTGKQVEAAGGHFTITFNMPAPSGAPAAPLPKAPRTSLTVDNV